MQYCEKCSCATEDSRCPLCGSRKLRDVRQDDYCFAAEYDHYKAAQRKEDLNNRGIEAVGVPYGDGFRSQLALPLENERLYVPFPQLHETLELLRAWEKEAEENIRASLKKRLNELYIAPDLAKKLTRKLRLAKEELIPCLQAAIASADKIYDGGAIANSTAHHYLCRTQRHVITLNSETMEVVAVDRR